MRYLSANGNSQDFPILPEGSHLARCYAVIDLGTHEKTYQGQTKSERQLRVMWEISGERMNDGRPFAISKTYKASLHEKANLRKHISSWKGKKMTEEDARKFDITTLLGKACMLGVVHAEGKDGNYATVDSIMPPPKGMQLPAQENPSIFFDLDEFDAEVYEKLPKGAKEKIAKSPEYAQATSSRPPARQSRPAPQESDGGPGDMDDDIPY